MKRKLIPVFIVLACVLFGCGKDQKEAEPKKYNVGDSRVCIYYPVDGEIVVDEELYQLKQPDSVTASVEEIMGVMSERINASVSYHTYMFDDENNLTLEFVADGDNPDKEAELLLKAAVAKTLFQLADMGTITINITFSDDSQASKSVYDRDSFYFLGYDEELALNTVKYKIYVLDDSGNALKKKWVSDNPKPCKSVVECIIERLNEQGVIPDGTEVKSVSIGSGICYIKLSNDFSNLMPNVSSELALYSVVNSITSVSGIDRVQIKIEGVNSGSYRGAVDITSPLEFNEDVLTEKE